MPGSAIPCTIALVEDEAVLRHEMAFQLSQLGFKVETFESAVGFYRFLAVNEHVIAVLDIGLDGEDGLSICRYLRQHNQQIGIVLISARGLRHDRLAGLAAGADAYLVKPLDIDELVLILKRLDQRARLVPASAPRPAMAAATAAAAAPSAVAQSAANLARELGWQLSTAGTTLLAPNGGHIMLAANESQLLRRLVRRAGEVCSHAELGGALGIQPDELDKHRLEVIISRLRAKALRQTGMRLPLQSSRGAGYCWVEAPEFDLQGDASPSA